MAVAKTHAPKAPSQKPTDFYKLKQQGGTHGKPQSVSEKMTGGPMREKMSKKGL